MLDPRATQPFSPPTQPIHTLGHVIPFSGFRSLVQAFTQLGTVVKVCTLPTLGRWALIRELGLHLNEMFCDTLTTPLVAEVVRRHKIINARLTCTGAAAVWGQLL